MSLTHQPSATNTGATVSAAASRPPWLDDQLFPFQSRFVELEGNRVHYIDEGTGPTLLFVHPGVGWSFTYRDVVKNLRDRFRCVALDLPGFGLSTAAPRYRHTLTRDSRLIERFIQKLGLRDITLFAHDITGAVGLGVVGRRPEWFRAVIIGPSFAWPLDAYPKVALMVGLVGSSFARFLGVTTDFFLEYYLKNVTTRQHEPFSVREKLAYRGPMTERGTRRHPHDLFKSAVRSRDYLADLEQRLRSLHTMPALLVFGTTDGLIQMGWLARLEQIFPRHRTVILAGCHHFPQEYDAAGVAAAIRRWWDDEVEP